MLFHLLREVTMRHITSAGHVLGATAFALVTGTAACGSPDAGMPHPGLEETAATAPAAAEPVTEEDAGFDTPDAAQHDVTADVYLASNIGGDPAAKDNNGFISRVSPDGAVIELRWIAGGTGDVVLHAPKGIALKGDSLFVTDID